MEKIEIHSKHNFYIAKENSINVKKDCDLISHIFQGNEDTIYLQNDHFKLKGNPKNKDTNKEYIYYFLKYNKKEK